MGENQVREETAAELIIEDHLIIAESKRCTNLDTGLI